MITLISLQFVQEVVTLFEDTVDGVNRFVDLWIRGHSSSPIQPIEAKFSVLTPIDQRGWHHGGLKISKKPRGSNPDRG